MGLALAGGDGEGGIRILVARPPLSAQMVRRLQEHPENQKKGHGMYFGSLPPLISLIVSSCMNFDVMGFLVHRVCRDQRRRESLLLFPPLMLR